VVTALRNIATTLDGRKELRREVRTQLAQVVASSYMVLAIGVGILLVLAVASPETLDRMLAAGLGRVAILAAAALFALGYFMIRRMTRIRT
jgi:tight adherence protein B